MSEITTQQRNQELQVKYNNYKETLSELAAKVGELQMEKEEHQLVIDTITPMDGDRNCFRLIGGVLVQRKVKEVEPTVQANLDGINNIIKQLSLNYEKTDLELQEFIKKNNIEVRTQ